MRRRVSTTRNVLGINGGKFLIVAPSRHLELINGLECGDGNW